MGRAMVVEVAALADVPVVLATAAGAVMHRVIPGVAIAKVIVLTVVLVLPIQVEL